MKYFKAGDILLSDFDGVFLDSQKKFDEVMQEERSLEKWMDFLNGINWKTFIRECDFIPGAPDTFITLQELKILQGFLTRIHSFEEGKEKALFLRELGLYVPIYYALIDQPKSLVYPPNRRVILLDDDEKNCEEWEEKKGKTILYNPSEKNTKKIYVKSLKELLK
ncbi:MAG: hypothetical protein IJI22_02600 [Bacilli bacterium]|nr:hypothetical protein [Bacilli bacterium]